MGQKVGKFAQFQTRSISKRSASVGRVVPLMKQVDWIEVGVLERYGEGGERGGSREESGIWNGLRKLIEKYGWWRGG